MAKKTTAGKSASRRKKPAEKVEDAQVVEERADVVDAVAGDAEVPQENEATEHIPDDPPQDAPGTQTVDPADTQSDEDVVPALDEVEDASPFEPRPVVEPAAQQQAGGNPIALIFGGVVAGAIGFFAAYVAGGINQPAPPEPVDLSGIEQSIETQNTRLDELAASIPETTAPNLAAVETSVDGLTVAIGDLEARVAALENRTPGEVGPSDPALRDDLDALKSTIAALAAENETAKANARSAAQATLRRAAMTQVQTALETGGSFAGALAELQSLDVDVPSLLSDVAENGVSTLASLQETFPEAARSALAADRDAAAASGETGGLTGFLRSQLGARSLTPQEGDSTDAVLSRAEAALREGRITNALAELETLPDVAQPAMTAWVELAARRADALLAAQTLSNSLN